MNDFLKHMEDFGPEPAPFIPGIDPDVTKESIQAAKEAFQKRVPPVGIQPTPPTITAGMRRNTPSEPFFGGQWEGIAPSASPSRVGYFSLHTTLPLFLTPLSHYL